ncbi:MAG TPA: hypothetical protein PLH36_16935, partial [Armatimonadota bacterium]|nr:hypothetical protein [Armatimonadota bacterium]
CHRKPNSGRQAESPPHTPPGELLRVPLCVDASPAQGKNRRQESTARECQDLSQQPIGRVGKAGSRADDDRHSLQ